MGLLDRLRAGSAGSAAGTADAKPDLARDARAMRETLDGMRDDNVRAGGPDAAVDLRGIVRDLFRGEVVAPTADVTALRSEGLDADEFYEKEVAPSWDTLGEAQRAARIDGFVDLIAMIEEAGDASGIPEDMAARTRTKALLLAWAFDETYGYLPRLGRGEDVKS
jgi:hypothetical protein